MKDSKIEWCHHTFNPWEGCTKVSAGCANCYAETRNSRFGGGTAPNWGPGAPRRRTSAANWNQMRKWDREAAAAEAAHWPPSVPYERPRVFCASLADIFDPEVPVAWRDDFFELCAACKNLDILVLTKRPGLMGDYLLGSSGAGAANLEEGGCFDHLWLGTSVENQKAADERIPKLLQIPARVRFLSCEPLLGPLEFSNVTKRSDCVAMLGKPALHGIHWVIAGGESGPKARPMHPAWARSLRDQCRAVGVPFLFKQWGEWAPGEHVGERHRLRTATWFDDRWDYGTETAKQSERCHSDDAPDVYRVGKHDAGRLLDGVEHNEFPNNRDDVGSGSLVLLRCPFCGAQPGIECRTHGGQSYYGIGCKTWDCRGNPGNLGSDLVREVRRWNTRTPSPQNAAIERGVRR